MPQFNVGKAVLDYDLAGDSGPLVVQLHGLTSSRDRDVQLGLDLARALRGHRVLRYDARGHGDSSGTTDPEDYRWDHLAEDLLALLDHVAPGERVHGVGPSMGTATLIYAALQEPNRFATLTLAVPPTAWKRRRAQAATYLANAELVQHGGYNVYLALGNTAPAPPALTDAPHTKPTVAEELLPTILRGASETDLPKRKKIREIEVPTLILAWSGDPTHPLKTARTLDEVLPDSRLVVARSPYGIMAWPGLFAEHVTMHNKS